MATASSGSEPASTISVTSPRTERADHMVGMKAVYDNMRLRSLRIRAYDATDPSAPVCGPTVKLVHFVRHGQGFHNLLADLAHQRGERWTSHDPSSTINPYLLPELLDAPLTERGRQEARKLQPRVQAMLDGNANNDDNNNNDHLPAPELIVISPNCRALQTSLIVFDALLSRVPFLAHEMVREETGVHLCDQRRCIRQQAKEFPQIDFSLLDDDQDVIFSATKRESKQDVAERVYQFMEWLSARPERVVGVATHSAWLLTVFNGVCETDNTNLRTWWQTGEMRSVKLEFITSTS